MLGKYRLCPCSTSLLFASNNEFQKSSDMLNKVKNGRANKKQHCKYVSTYVQPKTLVSVAMQEVTYQRILSLAYFSQFKYI